jgi:hypothetical protein
MPQPNQLTGREYKLLLAMQLFPGEPSLDLANAFWTKHLTPVIAKQLGPHDGKPRHDKGFKEDKTERRQVRYYDAVPRVLAARDYTLRERASSAEGAAERQVTLKLRMPDQFVVAGTRLHDPADGFDVKLEEDIAPLAAAEDDRADDAEIALATPRSIRSRFALSVSQSISAGRGLARLHDAFGLYPRLKDNLRAVKGPISADETLHQGPEISEVAFQGAKVDLGDGIEGKFALTLWHFRPDAARRDVAEISFRCKFDGAMPGDAARRALTLFIAMQEDPALLDLRSSSKTALALPR